MALLAIGVVVAVSVFSGGGRTVEANTVTDDLGTTSVTIENPPELYYSGSTLAWENGTWTANSPSPFVGVASFVLADDGNGGFVPLPNAGIRWNNNPPEPFSFPIINGYNPDGLTPVRIEVIAFKCTSTANFHGTWPNGPAVCESVGVLYSSPIPENIPANVPTNLQVVAGNSRALITWDASVVDENHVAPDEYRIIFIRPTTDDLASSDCDFVGTQFTTQKIFRTTGLSCSFTGLVNGDEQAVEVEPRSVVRGTINGPTEQFTPLATAPGPAESLEFSAVPVPSSSTAVVNLSWEASDSSYLFGETSTYDVRVNATGYVCSPEGAIVTVTSCQIHTSFGYGTVLTATVTAQNGAGNAPAATVSYTVPDVPSAPVLSGQLGDLSVGLSWTVDDMGSSITSNTVERSADGGSSWEELSSGISSAFTDSNLLLGEEYSYRSRAASDFGMGSYSNVVTIVAATSPDVVTGVSAIFRDSEATVTWDAPFNGGAVITSYQVQMSADGGEWTDVLVPPTGVSSVTQLRSSEVVRQISVLDLDNSSSYRFRVAAQNELGIGDYSEPSAPGQYVPPTTVPVTTVPVTTVPVTTVPVTTVPVTTVPVTTVPVTTVPVITAPATGDDLSDADLPATGAESTPLWILLLGLGSGLIVLSRRRSTIR